MNSTTSCSERPCASWVRASFFRSSASLACESAMVWFWQTRHRSCSATRWTRSSSAASEVEGAPGASSGHAMTRQASSRRNSSTIELPYDGQQFLAYQLRRQRTGKLQPYLSLFVDDEGLRHAVDAELDAGLAVAVKGRYLIGIAEFLQPLLAVAAHVVVVQPNDRRSRQPGKLQQHE